MKIEKGKTVYDGRLVIQEAEISDEEKSFKRQRIKREDAVAILILNTDTNKVVLTRQFRYPVAEQEKENILEIVAGKIDEGEAPLQTAIREIKEETGYQVRPENIKLLMSCYSSPGYTTEKFYVYYATVKTADKVAEGGGLKEENEKIEIVEMDLVKFTNLVRDGQLLDAKTYIAALYMILEWH